MGNGIKTSIGRGVCASCRVMHPVMSLLRVQRVLGNRAAWGVVMAASTNAHLPILLPVAAHTHTPRHHCLCCHGGE